MPYSNGVISGGIGAESANAGGPKPYDPNRNPLADPKMWPFLGADEGSVSDDNPFGLTLDCSALRRFVDLAAENAAMAGSLFIDPGAERAQEVQDIYFELWFYWCKSRNFERWVSQWSHELLGNHLRYWQYTQWTLVGGVFGPPLGPDPIGGVTSSGGVPGGGIIPGGGGTSGGGSGTPGGGTTGSGGGGGTSSGGGGGAPGGDAPPEPEFVGARFYQRHDKQIPIFAYRYPDGRVVWQDQYGNPLPYVSP